MTYALVQDDTIVQHGALPNVWNDGTRDWDLRPMSDAELAELGWLVVVAVQRPPDTATTTHDYTIELVSDVPTETWTPRPTTPDEQAGFESAANQTALVEESGAEVDPLLAVVDHLNTLTARTNADINSNPAAVIKDLARELKTTARQTVRSARLQSGKTDSTDTGS